MQVQERLTDQIKNCIQEALNPLGSSNRSTTHVYADERNTKTKFSNNYVFFTGAFEEDNKKRVY
jgi:GTP cyclohydrolase I